MNGEGALCAGLIVKNVAAWTARAIGCVDQPERLACDVVEDVARAGLVRFLRPVEAEAVIVKSGEGFEAFLFWSPQTQT